MGLPDHTLSTTPLPSEFTGLAYYDPARPLMDQVDGGIGLNDSSHGHNYQVWTCWCEPNVGDIFGRFWDIVYISAPNTPQFEFYRTTANSITSVSLAFDLNMQPMVIVLESGDLKLWWYDSLAGEYTVRNFGTGHVDPRMRLDETRPALTGVSDVIIAYLKNGKLYYREQRDRFNIEYLLDDGPFKKLTRIGRNVGLRFQFELPAGEMWPSDLPCMRLGFEYQPGDPQIRTSLAGGPLALRQGYAGQPVDFSAEWIFTDEQADEFNRFYHDTLTNGIKWFLMPVLKPTGLEHTMIRFMGGFKWEVLGGRSDRRWRYTADMQMYLRKPIGMRRLTSLLYPVLNVESNSGQVAVTRIHKKSIMVSYDNALPEHNSGQVAVTRIEKRPVVRYLNYDNALPEHNSGQVAVTRIEKKQTAWYLNYDNALPEHNSGQVTVTSIRKAKP